MYLNKQAIWELFISLWFPFVILFGFVLMYLLQVDNQLQGENVSFDLSALLNTQYWWVVPSAGAGFVCWRIAKWKTVREDNEKITNLKQEHSDEIRDLKQGHSDEIRDLKQEHSDKIRDLKQEHSDEVMNLKIQMYSTNQTNDPSVSSPKDEPEKPE